MFRPSILVLIVWLVLVGVSALGFAFLSTRPDAMLWVEEIHPSNAYLRGRELKKEGRFQEALAVFRRGRDYFHQIYRQTQSRDHRLHYLQGILELADTYNRMNDAESKNQALELYRQAVELEPSYAGGQPFLAMGLLLQAMKRYPEAITAYSGVLEHGSSSTAMQAIFERGNCFFEQREYGDAARDWYYYVRFNRMIPDWVWENLAALPSGENPDVLYIQARAATAKGDAAQAESLWNPYRSLRPQDRSANFYSALHITQPPAELPENIPLIDLFPPRTGGFYPIGSCMVDIYVSREGLYAMRLELECEGTLADLPRWRIEVNGIENVPSRIPRGVERHFETVDLSLAQGVNFIRMEILRDEKSSPVPLRLYSLSIGEKDRG